MTEQFDLTALEKALSPKKESAQKKEKTPKKGDKPLLVPVDKEGKEIDPKDMEVGKVYGLKQSE